MELELWTDSEGVVLRVSVHLDSGMAALVETGSWGLRLKGVLKRPLGKLFQ